MPRGQRQGAAITTEINDMTQPTTQPSPRESVEAFWRTANARQWPAFAALLHPQLVYLVPQTRERGEGAAALVDIFRTWPGDWVAEVQTLIADDTRAVSTVRFFVGDAVETGISFFEFEAGVIRSVTDYWPSAYEPPPRVSVHLKRD